MEAAPGPPAGLQKEGQRGPAEAVDAATVPGLAFRVLVVHIFLRFPDLYTYIYFIPCVENKHLNANHITLNTLQGVF